MHRERRRGGIIQTNMDLNWRTLMWKYSNGNTISCTQELEMLNENYAELKQTLQDALDDAVLIGCSENEIKQIFVNLTKSLISTYGIELTTKS